MVDIAPVTPVSESPPGGKAVLLFSLVWGGGGKELNHRARLASCRTFAKSLSFIGHAWQSKNLKPGQHSHPWTIVPPLGRAFACQQVKGKNSFHVKELLGGCYSGPCIGLF